MKNYNQFLKLNENDIFDDWDLEEEQPEHIGDNEIDDMVIDYNGYKIPKNDAVWCIDGVWCSKDEAIWSDHDHFYVSPDDENYIWVDSRRRFGSGDYIHRDDLMYSNRDGEFYMMEDAVWCDYEDDACLWSDAVECEDGEFAFRENVVEDGEGKIRHIDDVVWNEETQKYDYTG